MSAAAKRSNKNAACYQNVVTHKSCAKKAALFMKERVVVVK